MKELKHQDLLTLYKEGIDCDSDLYAEQRSNVLITAGKHYNKRSSKFLDRVRSDKGISQEQKVRLTKNHIQRACKIYENGILTYAPGVDIGPRNPSELQDQKSSELNNSVWEDLKSRHKLKRFFNNSCQDFFRIGEVFTKIYWDHNKGQFLGYEQQVDEMGMPVVDEMGQPVADKTKARFSGDLVYERVFGFNVFRAKEAHSMEDSWFVGIRKMVDINELKARVGDDPEKLDMIEESVDETYKIFDTNTGTHIEAKNQCLLHEIYIRPSINYPLGYYYIFTVGGILFEGELPAGKFPIAHEGCDENPTNPRATSLIKVMRPYQAEINRASSKIVENQISSDDKVLIQMGTKIQNGGMLPGVRAIQYAGQPPSILPGRSGEQYYSYIQMQIEEMYLAINLAEALEEKADNADPYTTLYKSMDQKKKYVSYSQKFMNYLHQVCEISLSLHKEFVSEDALIRVIGKSEFVNIEEYKNSDPLSYTIKLEDGNEDQETKFGRQLLFNNLIQYVGSNLDKRQLGSLFRLSPYANNEQAFEELTLDVDNATNMLLALDRGKQFKPSERDDPEYMMKKLDSRMRKADFEFLPMEVQENYNIVYQQFVQILAIQQQKIQEAALGYIPMSGMAVTCQVYVPNPNNSGKLQLARLPYDSVVWLLKRLEEQGRNQDAMMQQDSSTLADVADKLKENPPQAPIEGAGQALQPVLQSP